MKLTEILSLDKKSIVSIVGAGGKTSLMFQLAKELKMEGRVLITTTTKIYLPKKEQYDYLMVGANEDELLLRNALALENKIVKNNKGPIKRTVKYNKPLIKATCGEEELIKNGIWVLGEEINEDNKLTAVSDEKLRELMKFFDYILIEADGSKGKPLKGWREDEPVISQFTTCTIGVLSGQTLQLEINEENVHRVKRFVGKAQGKVSEEDLLEVIFNCKGMFRYSRGRKILFINQLDNKEIYEKDCNLISGIINKNWINQLLNQVIIGSLHKGTYFNMDLGGQHG